MHAVENSSKTTSESSTFSTDYCVSDYLMDRLVELGIHDIFGVPGDFNLGMLDHVISHPQLQWVGNANELNAGYAADGYARLLGIGALITTFGVGELSAINAVAGSYAEYVPVVHIVGTPSTEVQAAHKKIHHTLGDGDFEHFFRIYREVTCSHTKLTAANAISEIDRVLLDVVTQKLPGYIAIPTDIARMPAFPPEEPLVSKLRSNSSPGAKKAFAQTLRNFISHKTIVVLADLLVHRFGETETLNNLLSKYPLPHATLLWGKSIVDESHPGYIGIYAGTASEPKAKAMVENTEVLIAIGVQFTDTTTAGFTQKINDNNVVNISLQQSTIGKHTFAPLQMHDALVILDEILAEIPTKPYTVHEENIDTTAGISLEEIIDDSSENTNSSSHIKTNDATTTTLLTQRQLWNAVSQGLEPHNVVICDQGTPYTGMAHHHLPQGTTLIGQALWGSIGYALGATLGVGLAAPHRRPILLTGDGSAQLTIQELGVIAHKRIPAVIILVNNSGYTVERAIHGPHQPYNDIVPWRWQNIATALGAEEDFLRTFRASTLAELEDSLSQAAQHPDKLILIEAITDPLDYPPFMQFLVDGINQANNKK